MGSWPPKTGVPARDGRLVERPVAGPAAAPASGVEDLASLARDGVVNIVCRYLSGSDPSQSGWAQGVRDDETTGIMMMLMRGTKDGQSEVAISNISSRSAPNALDSNRALRIAHRAPSQGIPSCCCVPASRQDCRYLVNACSDVFW